MIPTVFSHSDPQPPHRQCCSPRIGRHLYRLPGYPVTRARCATSRRARANLERVTTIASPSVVVSIAFDSVIKHVARAVNCGRVQHQVFHIRCQCMRDGRMHRVVVPAGFSMTLSRRCR
jgi:hypothetical protein